MDTVRSWDNLPQDILSMIISHLLVGDICAFRAVCKWWKGTPSPINPIMLPMSVDICDDEPPFLMIPTSRLFHMVYKFSHHMQIYKVSGVIRASHCGWLLMTLYEERVFFFNPFTNEKIELPDMPFTHLWPNLTFSSPPNSPNCLIFGVQQKPTGPEHMINIFTIKPGQPNWTLHTFYRRPDFKLSSCNPVIFKGLYYCLGKGGSLLIYDPMKKNYRWLGLRKPPFRRVHSNGCCYYMVESKGKLLLVFTDREGYWVNVVRYCTKKNFWEKIYNLGDRMLFVSQATSFSAKSVVRGTGNKIYFPKFVEGDHLFYSLTTRKYHCIDGVQSWKSFAGTKSYANSAWIKPFHSS